MNGKRFQKLLSSILAITLLFALSIFLNRYFTENAKDKGVVPVFSLSEESGFTGDTLGVHFIDVGQGDSTLIQTDDGKSMLIDAGPYGASEKVYDTLTQQGVKELDYVVLTHPHEDHIGGAETVFESFSVKSVIISGTAHTSSAFLRLLEILQAQKDESKTIVVQPKVGETYKLGKATFTILSPIDPNEKDANNSSICLKLTYGKVSFLFTGDADTRVEKEMIAGGVDLDADIFKAGHHGSDTSNSEAFLDAISPKVAIISCGKDNSYGHPSISVLDRFAARKIKVLRTDLDGDVAVVTDGETFRLYRGKNTT